MALYFQSKIKKPNLKILISQASGDANNREAGNAITNSTLTFTPEMSQHGKKLECRAENPVLPNSIKTDEGRLNILCKYHNC